MLISSLLTAHCGSLSTEDAVVRCLAQFTALSGGREGGVEEGQEKSSGDYSSGLVRSPT